jgi:hypothetical protein
MSRFGIESSDRIFEQPLSNVGKDFRKAALRHSSMLLPKSRFAESLGRNNTRFLVQFEVGKTSRVAQENTAKMCFT